MPYTWSVTWLSCIACKSDEQMNEGDLLAKEK